MPVLVLVESSFSRASSIINIDSSISIVSRSSKLSSNSGVRAIISSKQKSVTPPIRSPYMPFYTGTGGFTP